MTRLIGTQRMVFQCDLGIQEATSDPARIPKSLQKTHIAMSDVRDWIDTLERRGDGECRPY